VERWATFDCYGTLVDWNTGIRSGIEALLGAEHSGERLTRYHELEREIQAATPGVSYREVLTLGLERLAAEEGVTLPEGEGSALARSLPEWPVFADVRPALAEARERGWRVAILSNTDRDLIDASMREIGVPFDLAVVAGDIGSYKPGHRHWEVFREQSGADPAGHVHVAQSLFHDIAPAAELGVASVWINREGHPPDPRPAETLRDLTGLADVLDRLVPSA
jgi:2-haloacid dehalogenase